MKVVRKRVYEAMQFDSSKPQAEWPSNVFEVEPGVYRVVTSRVCLGIENDDWVIWRGGGLADVIRPADFDEIFEEVEE